MLSRNHFFFVQNSIHLAQIDTDTFTHVALYNTGNHFTFFAKILIVKYFSLFFTDLLQDHVFGILSSNTAKGFGLYLHINNIAGFIGRIDHFGICQADLLYGIFHLFCDGLCRHHMEITGLPVNGYRHVVSFTEMIFAGLQK